ncbi:hypothetical protein LTS18_002931 [Coniosporium uncinatum]|uniref:Uncharacterized protein n=1 Tax=Coniosporium uncinatum TaxID=93489 RepID=A0ACC3DZA0_9PEZI|nr:hypothetical protein LTS18_002931 [Coniosporium uncinatum]
MVVSALDAGDGTNRKRRVHKKSRLGCRNCKLRSVKCDEGRPNCKRCSDYGVNCSYINAGADLEVLLKTTAGPEKEPATAQPLYQTMLGIMDPPSSSMPLVVEPNAGSVLSSQADMDRFTRFRSRTMYSIGNDTTGPMYRENLLRLSHQYTFLMHMILTITAIHDRYLSDPPQRLRTYAEIWHWTQASGLFNQALSNPLNDQDLDAIWAAAALLGVIVYSSTDATTAEESWPLKCSGDGELEWLRICDGKKTIWQLTNPSSRPGSGFFCITTEPQMRNEYLFPDPPLLGAEGLPPDLAQLCEVNAYSTSDNNPYHGVLHALAPLLDMEMTRASGPRFFSLLHFLSASFRTLLENKDPRALLVLALWYARICNSGMWWVDKRAKLEGQAICIYLERYHWTHKTVMRLLEGPKMRCGLPSTPASLSPGLIAERVVR